MIAPDADPADLDRRVVALLLATLRADAVAADALLGDDVESLRVLLAWAAVWMTTTLAAEWAGSARRRRGWRTGRAAPRWIPGGN